MFAARRPRAGGNGSGSSQQTGSRSATTTTTTTVVNTASPATTKFVAVTKQVAAASPRTTSSLSERQALVREQERRRRRQLQAEVEQQEYYKQQAQAQQKRRKLVNGSSSSSIVVQAKGKGKQRESERSSGSSSNDEEQSRAKAAVTTKYTVEAFDADEDDQQLGTPVNDRRGPLKVLRQDLAASKDELESVPVMHSETLVRSNMTAYVQYFPDVPSDVPITLEYPGDSASESFLLCKPRARDQQDYQPVQDILATIRVVLDWFLTAEQALEHFKHVQSHAQNGHGGEFDFLKNDGSGSSSSSKAVSSPSSASHPPPPPPSSSGAIAGVPLPVTAISTSFATRDSTPASDTGTPEPTSAGLLKTASTSSSTPTTTATAQGSAPASLYDQSKPLYRQLERAQRRLQGQAFVAAIEHYNSVLASLKVSGSIRDNIIKMGQSQGVPEPVWDRIAGQCYERTVGPRIEELKKYEAFSDNTYGELLPPFVSHIANLTGLGPDSVLVDMGSGVGNCCVQASLATGCKSYGFENQPAAASIAQAQVEEAGNRARLWGIRMGACETHEADFLASPGITNPAMSSADVVLVNNYVFSPKTNEQLSLMFLDLKDGAKVVSLRPFVTSAGETAITPRNVGSPANILNQRKPIRFDRNSVSWSAEGGTFYLAEVNRDRLRRYLERMG